MTQPHAGTTLKSWQAPECPFAIEYAPAVMEEIRQAAVEAFFSLPHGGTEIGGVLFGAAGADGRVRITAFRPLACEHARGPRFLLSPKDLEQLQVLLRKSAADPLLRGLQAVGWYHTHTRSDIFLCAQDLAIYDRFFPEFRQVALVVRPDGFKATRAGFFFRDASGAVHAESTYREFVVEIASGASSCDAPACQEEPAPAPVPAPPAVYRPAPPRTGPPPALAHAPQRSFAHPARSYRWHRGRGAIAATCAGVLFAGALTSVESVLAARIVTIEPAPPVILPALPPPPPAAKLAPLPEATTEAAPDEVEAEIESESESESEPQAPPKRWAGLQPSGRRTDPPVLPQAPAPDLVKAQPAGTWPAPPLAAGPHRMAFEGGIITFFAANIVVMDKKHPKGISLPAHGVDYTCESRSQTCIIATGATRLRLKHAADYKLLVDYLTQAR